MNENVEPFSPRLLAVMIIASLTINKNLGSISQIGFLDGFSVVLLSKFMQIWVSLSLNRHIHLHCLCFPCCLLKTPRWLSVYQLATGWTFLFQFPVDVGSFLSSSASIQAARCSNQLSHWYCVSVSWDVKHDYRHRLHQETRFRVRGALPPFRQ